MAYIGYFIVKDSSNNLALDICILLPPISFFSGIVASILTRKHKERNSALWWSGFAICLVGTILYALLILLLIRSSRCPCIKSDMRSCKEKIRNGGKECEICC